MRIPILLFAVVAICGFITLRVLSPDILYEVVLLAVVIHLLMRDIEQFGGKASS